MLSVVWSVGVHTQHSVNSCAFINGSECKGQNIWLYKFLSIGGKSHCGAKLSLIIAFPVQNG